MAFCLQVQAGFLNTSYYVVIWPVSRRKGRGRNESLSLRTLSRTTPLLRSAQPVFKGLENVFLL
jgi:hypothetical protein